MDKKQEKLPVSVVVPAYNESAMIRDLFVALDKQNFPKNQFEIIVVDNASTDDTSGVVRKAQEEFPGLNIMLVQESREGVSFARDTAWRHARGEILASTDADCRPVSVWLETGLRYLEEHPETVCVSGIYDYHDAPILNPFAYGFQKYLMIPTNYLTQRCGKGAISIGGNSFLRRSAVEEIGGYSMNIGRGYGEDVEIASRLTSLGRVDYTASLSMPSSARRFHRTGIFYLPFTYTANAFSLWLRKKPLGYNFRDK